MSVRWETRKCALTTLGYLILSQWLNFSHCSYVILGVETT